MNHDYNKNEPILCFGIRREGREYQWAVGLMEYERLTRRRVGVLQEVRGTALVHVPSGLDKLGTAPTSAEATAAALRYRATVADGHQLLETGTLSWGNRQHVHFPRGLTKVVDEVVHRFASEKRSASEASGDSSSTEVGYLYEFRPRRIIKKMIFGIEFEELDEGTYRRFKIIKRTAQSIFYHPVPDVLDPVSKEMVEDRRDDQGGDWGTRTKRLDLVEYRAKIDLMRNWEATIANSVTISDVKAAPEDMLSAMFDRMNRQKEMREAPRLWLSLEDRDVWAEGHARVSAHVFGHDYAPPTTAKKPDAEELAKLKRYLRDNHPDRGGDPAEYRKAIELWQSLKA